MKKELQFFTFLVCLALLLSANWAQAQNPGGVSGVHIWYRADIGASNSQWLDQSGNNFTMNSSVAAQQPTLNTTTGLVNFNPQYTYGAGDRFTGAKTGIFGNVLSSATFFVGKTNSGGSNAGSVLYSGATSTSPRINWHFNTTSTAYDLINYETTRVSFTNTAANETQNYKIWSGRYGSLGSSREELFLNGQTKSSRNVIPGASNNLSSYVTFLGYNPDGSLWAGNYGEIISYINDLTPLNRLRVESYLGIKYGVTLSNNTNGNGTINEAFIGGVEGDYIASDGTTKTWDGLVNTSYHNNIAGIGRDDNTALNQKESQSINSTTQVTIALSTLAATNATNTNTFASDKQFLVWGDDNASITATTDIAGPGSLTKRLNRTWKLQNTNTFGQQLTLYFPTASVMLAGDFPALIYASTAAGLTGNTDVTVIPATATANINGVASTGFVLTFPTTGTLYFTFAGAATVICTAPPTITTPPAPVSICAGGNASFTVTPAGTAPFTYQWHVSYDGGVSYYDECDACSSAPAVSGGLSQTVSYTGITAAYGSRLYKVTITNACGSVTSLPAQLTVNSLPTVAAPAAQTVCPASAAVFSPAVTGNGVTAYQWNWNGSPLAADHAADANGLYTGSKTAVLTLTPTAASTFNGGSFTLSLTNSCGTTTSQPATLTVIPLPAAPALAVAVQPTCAVTNGTFTITNFNAAYSYMITPLAGVARTGNTVTAPAGSYTVTATASGCSSAASAPVTLNAAPGAPQQPVLAVLTQPTCTLASGSFSITNYNAAYAYTVSPATATLSGSTITAPAGTYTVTATASGCTSAASAPVVINAQPSLAAPVITAVNPTCQILTGSVAVTAPIAGATYMLMPSGITNTTGTFAALPAASGPYTVSAALAGCNSAVSNPVSVGPPATGCVAPCEANAGTIMINP